MKTVAVIGLGMIGGSVARGLASKGIRVVGYDRDESQIDAAVDEGVVSARIPSDFSHVADADTVVIAVYGDKGVEILQHLEQHANNLQLVTDVGSTKRKIVAAADQSVLAHCFVGAHPFSGDHRSGWNASRGDLFENELVYLCPSERTTAESIALASALWNGLGARISITEAAAHDEEMAWASHLPHVVSTAFAMSLASRGVRPSQLGRGGRDVARLAGGSPEMWTAITKENGESIDEALSQVQHKLDDFRRRLLSGSEKDLQEWFTRARAWTLVS